MLARAPLPSDHACIFCALRRLGRSKCHAPGAVRSESGRGLAAPVAASACSKLLVTAAPAVPSRRRPRSARESATQSAQRRALIGECRLAAAVNLNRCCQRVPSSASGGAIRSESGRGLAPPASACSKLQVLASPAAPEGDARMYVLLCCISAQRLPPVGGTIVKRQIIAFSHSCIRVPRFAGGHGASIFADACPIPRPILRCAAAVVLARDHCTRAASGASRSGSRLGSGTRSPESIPPAPPRPAQQPRDGGRRARTGGCRCHSERLAMVLGVERDFGLQVHVRIRHEDVC